MSDSKPNLEKVLTALEVSRYLKIPLSTLYGLSKQRKIRGVKVGKHWRYRVEDIRNYLLGGTSKPDPLSGPMAPDEDRRFHPRINSEMTAQLFVLLPNLPARRQGVVRNLSSGGVAFSVPDGVALRIGDPVRIEFELPQKGALRPISVEGRLIHRRYPSGHWGIKFRGISTQDQEAIEAYVG